jgi:hypothetical protein
MAPLLPKAVFGAACELSILLTTPPARIKAARTIVGWLSAYTPRADNDSSSSGEDKFTIVTRCGAGLRTAVAFRVGSIALPVALIDRARSSLKDWTGAGGGGTGTQLASSADQFRPNSRPTVEPYHEVSLTSDALVSAAAFAPNVEDCVGDAVVQFSTSGIAVHRCLQLPHVLGQSCAKDN